MIETIGNITKFESFGLVDGPGIRYIIFLQGCKLRCKYCHNPETWASNALYHLSPKQTFDRIYESNHDYWGKDGGITFSGGEPLLQIDYLIETSKLFKEKGVHIAIDTAGQPFDSSNERWMKKFDELLSYVDLFLFDIKQMDNGKHKSLTGAGNENILEMAKYLSDKGKDIWIRYVLVPGLTDDEKDLKDASEFIASLKTIKRVEVLPYHSFGIAKYENLNIPYQLMDQRGPNDEEKLRAETLLNANNYKDYLQK